MPVLHLCGPVGTQEEPQPLAGWLARLLYSGMEQFLIGLGMAPQVDFLNLRSEFALLGQDFAPWSFYRLSLRQLAVPTLVD